LFDDEEDEEQKSPQYINTYDKKGKDIGQPLPAPGSKKK
jgi:hypothetical protein